MYRLREFFRTLFNHRAIIKKLSEEKVWIENNAVDIINLVNKNGVILTIEAPLEMFGWLYRLRKHVGIQMVQAAFISNYKIAPVRKVEKAIEDMADFVKKAAEKKKKGGKDVKADTKRQTNNKEK